MAKGDEGEKVKQAVLRIWSQSNLEFISKWSDPI